MLSPSDSRTPPRARRSSADLRAADRGARSLRESIRTAAHGLGFDQVGFAPAKRPAHADAYLAWLERGWHGEMAYMAREDAVRRRLSPAEALTGCRTVIVTSLVYGAQPGPRTPEPSPDAPFPAPAVAGPAGRRALPIVARYASGRDYHGVFEERLDRLAEQIEVLAPGSRTKRYVDYGPVLEREHAQRAGLGWIAKNTMLIHPRLGSYLLLGELLTTLELPPDEPFTEDRCGTCERCIVACPTDAIRSGRRLDARRCISYLTIELRGAIPLDLRPLIGTHVFGCDICQEVCPWNSHADGEASGSPFALEPGRPFPRGSLIAWVDEILPLSAATFRERYRGTALTRPGRDGLLRNLAVALGNAGGEGAVGALQRLTADRSELVREHARWALDRLGA